MSDKGGEESAEVGSASPTAGFVHTIQEQWRKTKEHAETYPYVWGSYLLVYTGLGVYLTWRYRKLRATENRVRVLQDRLKKLVEAEEANKPPTAQS